MPSTALLWYRRDLRVHDHPALVTAAREFDRVVPVFVLDDALLHGRFASGSRTRFMLGCLRALDESLRERGSGLVIRHGAPERELPALAAEAGADAVLWTSDVAPYARGRDGRVTEALRSAGVRARPSTGTYCVDVSKVRTKDGRPFTVFSPFRRAWSEAERRTVHRAPAALAPLPAGLATGRLPAADALGLGDDVPEPIAKPGEPAARAALERWLRGAVDHYAERPAPTAKRLVGMARVGTSVLSPYLRWGCLSARECEQRAGAHGGRGAGAWVRQLAWRDFYASVLLAFPGNAREEFQERFRGTLDWDDAPERLAAWQEGRTGYPLVDAGMRQLARTGWMHNRVRLVVGSFLTKDLHLDWRAGEAWFERLLLDGEPAQNNGNWQWIASVGVDPAPYFRRMYNPALHQQRFDPQGAYVRRWVPELEGVPGARLAEPWTMTDAEQRVAGCVVGRDYPAPVVDHAAERRVALERFRAAAG
jgi:deoxyribodipyrimidine photo-lyase